MMSLISSSREMLQGNAWLLAHRRLKAQHVRRMEERLPSDGPPANFDFGFERMILVFTWDGRPVPTRYPHTR